MRDSISGEKNDNLLLCRVRQVLERAGDSAEVDLSHPRALPDESNQTALHQPFAGHTLPKVRAGLGLRRMGATRRCVDRDANVQPSIAWGDGKELDISINIEHNGVSSDCMSSVLSTVLLQQAVKPSLSIYFFEIGEDCLCRGAEGRAVKTIVRQYTQRENGKRTLVLHAAA